MVLHARPRAARDAANRHIQDAPDLKRPPRDFCLYPVLETKQVPNSRTAAVLPAKGCEPQTRPLLLQGPKTHLVNSVSAGMTSITKMESWVGTLCVIFVHWVLSQNWLNPKTACNDRATAPPTVCGSSAANSAVELTRRDASYHQTRNELHQE